MDKELDEALLDAEESLRVAITAIERLAAECREHKAGESGMAAERIEAYILPALNTWLYSDSQIASLRDLREEIERGWTWLQREQAGKSVFNDDGSARNSEMTSEEARNTICEHERVDDDGWCEDCGDLIHLIDDNEARQEHLNMGEDREHNEDGHGFSTPRGDWPDRPSNPDDFAPPGHQG